MTCSLCDDCPDSLNHLFFECTYARRIWNDFKQRTEQDSMPEKWGDIVNFMVRQNINKSIKRILKRIGFAACVYYIWIKRNRRIFSNEKRDTSELIKTIVNYLRLKLSSLKVKKTAQVEDVRKKWKVVMNVINEEDSLLQDFHEIAAANTPMI